KRSRCALFYLGRAAPRATAFLLEGSEMDVVASLGLRESGESAAPTDAEDQRQKLLRRVNLRLVADGLVSGSDKAAELQDAAGGLPIPGDKKSVPKRVFAELFRQALSPPPEALALPFTVAAPEQARTFVSLLLRPTVCPEVPGVCAEKSMEVRFFAPGNLVSN